MPPASATPSLDHVALFQYFPGLRRTIPWVPLGCWPTPVEPLPGIPGAHRLVYVKREDLSSPRYGGNKVRTLEAAFGRAMAAGSRTVWATGAFGSNHATATTLHAPMAAMEPGIALFPQPPSPPAKANLAAMLAARPAIAAMHTVIELPFVMALLRRRDKSAYVMPPGFATPHGALGALSAALELGGQVAAGQCPAPVRIVLACGSTCTTAGLLAGLHLACALGIGFRGQPPQVTAVRVTPWPITDRTRIAHLAYQTASRLADLLGRQKPSFRALHAALTVEGRYLGAGYGHATASGHHATAVFQRAGGPPLDLVYSAKSGAALIELARRRSAAQTDQGPLLFWATKSSAPLPHPNPGDITRAPAAIQRWLRR